MSELAGGLDAPGRACDVVIEARGVTRRFAEAALDVSVLEGVDLQLMRGQSLALVGASGSGKSTLLHLLGGLDQPTSGSVRVMGRDWSSMGVAQQGHWRNRHVGFVYQFHHLLPEFTALDNVAMPLRIRRSSVQAARGQALQALQAMGLADRAEHRPAELSGGERQRVAVARAWVTRPACIMADEPTGNLDRRTADAVFELLLQRTRDEDMALLLVTHDEQLARRCDGRLELSGGRLSRPGLGRPADGARAGA